MSDGINVANILPRRRHTRRHFNCCWSFVYCVIILCVSLLPNVYCFTVCIAVLHTLVEGLLARSQNPEGPATVQQGTGFFFLGGGGFPVSISEC